MIYFDLVYSYDNIKYVIMKNQNTKLVQPRLKNEIYNKIEEMSKKYNLSVKFICEYYIEECINSDKPIVLGSANDQQK